MDRKVQPTPQRSPRHYRLIVWPILLFVLAWTLGTFKNISTKRVNDHAYQLAPRPEAHPEAIVQVYAARTRGMKKKLAVHSWITWKRKNDDGYMVSQVIGWRLRRYGTTLFTRKDIPDEDWYGNPPELILDIRGVEAEQLITKLEEAANSYPWADTYTVWPGPNSNTYVAWMGLQVPELGLDLPATAIGKDWRPLRGTLGRSASGTGLQASIYGLMGITMGYEEGLEINILGLSIELDVFDLAIELPGFGRIG